LQEGGTMEPGNAATLAIAIYAALVATASFGWTVYVALRDRAAIHVSFDHHALQIGGQTITYLLGVKAANRGRRPVTLVSCECQLSNSKRLTFVPSPLLPLPAKIDEGESYTS